MWTAGFDWIPHSMIIVRVVFLFRTVTLIVGFLFCQLSKDFFIRLYLSLFPSLLRCSLVLPVPVFSYWSVVCKISILFYRIEDHFFYRNSSVLIIEKRQMSLGSSILLKTRVYGNVSVLFFSLSVLEKKPCTYIILSSVY